MARAVQDPRAELRRRIAKDVVKQSQNLLVKFDGFLSEFPDSEIYAGDAARFWFRNLRAAVEALITVAVVES